MTTDTAVAPLRDLSLKPDTSAWKARIEFITGVERRRWSWEQKRSIVVESRLPHASPAAVARKHGIGTGQLYTWRQQLLGSRPAGQACFARVEIAKEPPRLAGPPGGLRGLIEIALPDGIAVRVDAGVAASAQRRLLAALRGPAGAKPEIRFGEGR